MTNETFPRLEIPAGLRDVADRSVEQARTAFDGFMTATHKAVSTFEDQANSTQSQTRDIARKAVADAEKAVAEAFDHAQKLVKAKDFNEIVALQSAFLNAQAARMQAQAQEFGQTLTQAAKDAMSRLR